MAMLMSVPLLPIWWTDFYAVLGKPTLSSRWSSLVSSALSFRSRSVSVPGCCFVTFFTRKAALKAQDALHNVKTLTGVRIC